MTCAARRGRLGSPYRLALGVLLVATVGGSSCGGPLRDTETKGASPSRPSEASSTNGHYQEFSDAEGHFSIEYPIDWGHEAQAGDVFMPPGSSHAGVIVGVASYQFLPPPSPKEQMHDRLPDPSLFPGTKIVDEGAKELSGYPAYSAHWFDTSSGRTLEVYEVITNGDASGRLYSIRSDGPPHDVQGSLQEYESIVASFRILDASGDGTS